MSEPYAHDALVALDDGADPRGPGGAVTMALCGSWEHDGPCPLAPHQTDVTERAQADGAPGLAVRVVFVCDPVAEPEVRHLLVGALRQGRQAGPDGSTSSWRLLEERPSAIADDEHELAWRLAQSLE